MTIEKGSRVTVVVGIYEGYKGVVFRVHEQGMYCFVSLKGIGKRSKMAFLPIEWVETNVAKKMFVCACGATKSGSAGVRCDECGGYTMPADNWKIAK